MAMFSEAPRGGSGDMETPQKMRRHGQYFAKPIPVVNERLLRGSGVFDGQLRVFDPEAEAQAIRSLSEPKIRAILLVSRPVPSLR